MRACVWPRAKGSDLFSVPYALYANFTEFLKQKQRNGVCAFRFEKENNDAKR